MNRQQCEQIVRHVIKPTERRAAVVAVIIDGLSVYAAEKQYGIPSGSLNRNVNKVRKEWVFVSSLSIL